MTQDNFQSQHPEDDSSVRVGNLSMIELGEKLYLWRHYTSIPALMILLFFAHPSARSATVGTLLILLGAAARLYTVAFMGDESRTTGALEDMVTTGPFALIRNPLYVANLTITFGVVFYCGVISLGFLALSFFFFQYYCISKYEENTLLAKFGEEYQRYMDRVPGWAPLKVPIAEDFPVPPSISSAFEAEKHSLAAVGAIIFLLMLAAH
jgi:protein-S-isoprenylcysteine O-methyltransferase Ste14